MTIPLPLLSLLAFLALVYASINADRLVNDSAPWLAWKRFIAGGLDLAIAILILNQIGPWHRFITNFLDGAFFIAFVYFGISAMKEARTTARDKVRSPN
jgi:hypothetical protein